MKRKSLTFSIWTIVFVCLIILIFPKMQTVYLTRDVKTDTNKELHILSPIDVIVNKNADEWFAFDVDFHSPLGRVNKNDVAFIGTPEYEAAQVKKEEIIKQQEEELQQQQRKIEERNKKVKILSKKFGYSQYGEKAVVGQIKNGSNEDLWIRADIKLYDGDEFAGDTYTYEYVDGGSIWNFEAPTFGVRANTIKIDLSISSKDE